MYFVGGGVGCILCEDDSNIMQYSQTQAWLMSQLSSEVVNIVTFTNVYDKCEEKMFVKGANEIYVCTNEAECS